MAAAAAAAGIDISMLRVLFEIKEDNFTALDGVADAPDLSLKVCGVKQIFLIKSITTMQFIDHVADT